MAHEKTAEASLSERMANITGARTSSQTKLAQMVPAHAETTDAEAIEKLASMGLDEITKHAAFNAGFERRLIERMPEIDAAIDRVITTE